jgi:hypothetical protein
LPTRPSGQKEGVLVVWGYRNLSTLVRPAGLRITVLV